MTDFTILDGIFLMIVAMFTVFVVLAGLWGILVLISKWIIKQEKNGTPEMTDTEDKNQENLKDGAISPEIAAIIISLLFETEVENIKLKDKSKNA